MKKSTKVLLGLSLISLTVWFFTRDRHVYEMEASYFEECLSAVKCFETVGDGMRYDPTGYIPIAASATGAIAALLFGILMVRDAIKKKPNSKKR